MARRHIIIGDVHGMTTELKALVGTVELTKDDQLVFVGDLIDKGPDSAGTVTFARKLRDDGYDVVLILQASVPNHQNSLAQEIEILVREISFDGVHKKGTEDHVVFGISAARIDPVNGQGLRQVAAFPHTVGVPNQSLSRVEALTLLLMEQVDKPIGIKIARRQAFLPRPLPVSAEVALEIPPESLVPTLGQTPLSPSVMFPTIAVAVLFVMFFPSSSTTVMAITTPPHFPFSFPLGDCLPNERIPRLVFGTSRTSVGVPILSGFPIRSLRPTVPVTEVPFGLPNPPRLPFKILPTGPTWNHHSSFTSRVA